MAEYPDYTRQAQQEHTKKPWQASKPRNPITMAARHRPPQPTFTTQRTVAYASQIQTMLTSSLEYSTTSPHGPIDPLKNSMFRVYNTHVIPACAGYCTHVGFLNMMLSPTLTRQMTPHHAIHLGTACDHPCTPQDAPEWARKMKPYGHALNALDVSANNTHRCQIWC